MPDGNAIAGLPAGGIKTFSCPSCGGTVGIRAVGTAITAACQSCGSLIDVANAHYRILQEAAVKFRASLIPLGARAVLFAVEWEVIGYSVRSDDTGLYDWREYLLFNPYQGFRFLVEADGHWNFVKSLRRTVEGDGSAHNLWFEDREYRLYTRGRSKVEYVMGEFYWRIRVGEKTLISEYVSPPYLLSMERSDADILWSKGTYVNADEIRRAFTLADVPSPAGIAPNQSSPFAGKGKGLMTLSALFFAVLLAIQIIAVSHSANRTIYRRTLQVPAGYKGQLLIADPVDIPGNPGNVEIWARSPVINDWVELDISLVNDANQESDDIILPIEYYYGSDSDGAWSEGRQSNEAMLSAVPGGRYHLQVTPEAGAFLTGRPVDIEVRILRDVPVWGNFWIALLLLAIYPFYVMICSWRFESRRWANSDYAPTIYTKGAHT